MPLGYVRNSAIRQSCCSCPADESREVPLVIDSEREALLRLRADGAIDDDMLRALERELDLEERRMDA